MALYPSRCLSCLGLLLMFASGTAAQPVRWPSPDWATSTPEAQGMDSRSLAELVDFGAKVQMDSLVIVRNGVVVTEAYYAPFRAGMKHRINSATKAVVGMLAGIASGQGALGSTDSSVLDLFGGRPVANVDARKRSMTLQHLLDMTSGLAWTEPLAGPVPVTAIAMEGSADWQQFVLDQPMALAPGARFNYNSGNAHLVAALIARRSGMGTEQYAAQHLFQPLGITDYRWLKDPQGVSTGGWGLYLRTPDMAKLGWLYLQRGQWNGRQLVPQAWVDRIPNARVDMDFPGWRYADFWWTLPSRKAYVAAGFNRQLIVVLPELGLVAATTGRGDYRLESFIDQLTGAVKADGPIARDAQAQALLLVRVLDAATEKRTSPWQPRPPWAEEVSGKTYRLAANPVGLTELTLHLGEQASYDVVNYVARGSSETRKLSLPLGMTGLYAAAGDPAGGILSRGEWVDGSSLRVVQRHLEEGSTTSYLLRFVGKQLELTATDKFGRKTTLTGSTTD